MSIDVDVAQFLQKAGRAMEQLGGTMKAYQGDVMEGRWDAAEDQRLRAHVALDDFLDSFGVAYKQIEAAKREQKSGGQ